MTLKNKKNLGNKAVESFSVSGSRNNRPDKVRTAVVVDLAASRRKTQAQDILPAAEGLRLVQAFLKIPDPVKRAELIRMAEDYVRRAR
jgi:hypothetical protein